MVFFIAPFQQEGSSDEEGKMEDSPIGKFSERLEVLGCKTMRCRTDVQFEHSSSSVYVWKWDINTFLKTRRQGAARWREIRVWSDRSYESGCQMRRSSNLTIGGQAI